EPEEERQVVEREQSMREELAGHEEVPEVGAREAAARVALAIGVERGAVARVPSLFERDGAVDREGLAVARVARREHAVEYVDAARDRLDEVFGLADSHEVARPLRGHEARDQLGQIVHRRLWLADRHPAALVAVEAELHRPPCPPPL